MQRFPSTAGRRPITNYTGSTAPWMTMWRRRAISVTCFTFAFLILVCTFPVLMAVALVVDLVRRRHLSATRLLLFIVCYLGMELAGVAGAFLCWLGSGVWAGADRERFVRWNFRLQCWWASSLARVSLRIFHMRVDVADEYQFGLRPVILFIRHTSFADTVIAAHLISSKYGIRLRYVLKADLLWDPCLDIVGHRLQNHFVRRGDMTGSELTSIGRLMRDLGPDEGVLLYPEGTRFTTAKRERALASLAKSKDQSLYEKACAMPHVIPPRLGGALALLQANTGADAVFCAHTGLEGSATFRDIINGQLIGKTVYVKWWGVPFEEIPRNRRGQEDWLFEQWQHVDAFVSKHTP